MRPDWRTQVSGQGRAGWQKQAGGRERLSWQERVSGPELPAQVDGQEQLGWQRQASGLECINGAAQVNGRAPANGQVDTANGAVPARDEGGANLIGAAVGDRAVRWTAHKMESRAMSPAARR